MFTLAALFVAITGVYAQAGTVEIPVQRSERIVISVPEAILHLQSTPNSRNLKIQLLEGAEEYGVQMQGRTVRIEPRDPVSKEKLGRFVPRKRVIEIQGPSVPLEVHLFNGELQLNRWSREVLVQLQKGKIISKDGSGTLSAHSQNGEIQVLDHQGRLHIDCYKSVVVIRNLVGDADVENFAGETVIDKAHGLLSLNQGQGVTKVTGSSGTLQFESVKGAMNVRSFQGRVEGQSQEAPVTVALAQESEVNIRSQSGPVSVSAFADSGATLNLTTSEGEIQAPPYLRPVREGGQKVLRGQLKGEAGKLSVVIRSQEGSILIR